jgi:hypothetical protein
VLDRDDALRDLLNGSSLEDADPRNYDAYVQTSQIIAGRVGVSPGQQAFVVNGRVCARATDLRLIVLIPIPDCWPCAYRRIPSIRYQDSD